MRALRKDQYRVAGLGQPNEAAQARISLARLLERVQAEGEHRIPSERAAPAFSAGPGRHDQSVGQLPRWRLPQTEAHQRDIGKAVVVASHHDAHRQVGLPRGAQRNVGLPRGAQRNVGQMFASDDHGAGDGQAVEQVEGRAQKAQPATPRVWPRWRR